MPGFVGEGRGGMVLAYVGACLVGLVCLRVGLAEVDAAFVHGHLRVTREFVHVGELPWRTCTGRGEEAGEVRPI